MTFPPSPTLPSLLHKISTIFSTHHTIYKYPQRYPLPFPQDTALPHFPPLSLSLSVLPSLDRPQEKLLGQSQWKDYSAGGHPPHHPPYQYNDSFETDGDMKAGWQQQRGSYERHGGGGGGGGGGGHHTHSLPRPPAQHHGGHQSHGGHHPMGYSSFDRRAGGYNGRPPGPHDFAPDHYFMPSQRKYQGEVLRVYVDYNK